MLKKAYVVIVTLLAIIFPIVVAKPWFDTEVLIPNEVYQLNSGNFTFEEETTVSFASMYEFDCYPQGLEDQTLPLDKAVERPEAQAVLWQNYVAPNVTVSGEWDLKSIESVNVMVSHPATFTDSAERRWSMAALFIVITAIFITVAFLFGNFWLFAEPKAESKSDPYENY